VDDDPQIQRMLSTQLSRRDYDVQVVANRPNALTAIAAELPDLVLLDLNLAGEEGLEIGRELRAWSSVPIIVLTVHDGVRTKIEALDACADDYLTKPFHMGELLARIRTVLRRASGAGEPAPRVIAVGELTIDLARRQVCRGDDEIRLTRTEFDLLREFVTHADRVLTYGHLLHAVWGPNEGDVPLVQVHVGNLRRKIERDPAGRRYLISIRGVGYRFQQDDETAPPAS
jgi:two-component system KDP operon response regulator KdpE